MKFWMTDHDSDNDTVISEVLQAAKPRLTPQTSPEPQVTRRSSTESRSSRASARSKRSNNSQKPARERPKPKEKRVKINHRPVDATFFRHFAPNNPEFLQTRTFDQSSSDDEAESMDGAVKVSIPEAVLDRTQLGTSRSDFLAHRSSLSLGHYNEASQYGSSSSWSSQNNSRAVGIDTRFGSRSHDDYDRHRTFFKDTRTRSLNEKDHYSLDSAAVDGLLKLKGIPMRRTSTSSEVVATSPTLIPHLISHAEGAPEQTLAAIAPESPLGPPPSNSFEPKISLPPVRELIGIPSRQRTSSYSSAGSTPAAIHPPIYNQAPGAAPLTRTSTAHSRDTGSPPRHSPELMTSPIDAGSYHSRRVGPRQGPIPSLPSHHHDSSSSTRSYSNGAGTSTSTSTNTSTSSEGLTPLDRSLSSEARGDASNDNLSTKYVHYPSVPIGGYKCQYEGCDAAPFSTQYLLNSHANVHSSERPHFCPVKGCPRGEGGQGFKRKNEMIRHGLVHQSPMYLCPWCDREHRYPRPDNLQRHVSTHHKDKNRDDPLLLQVLAQRAPGGTNRRRRRT